MVWSREQDTNQFPFLFHVTWTGMTVGVTSDGHGQGRKGGIREAEGKGEARGGPRAPVNTFPREVWFTVRNIDGFQG